MHKLPVCLQVRPEAQDVTCNAGAERKRRERIVNSLSTPLVTKKLNFGLDARVHAIDHNRYAPAGQRKHPHDRNILVLVSLLRGAPYISGAPR